jgi:pimeloyl-ACP methyl ester carboxylesterase
MGNYVLVHGAFVGGWTWSETAEVLRKGGHRVDVIEQLPSGGSDTAHLGDLKADVDCVRQAVEDVGEPVVLVGHSYGGMVLTELADHPAVAHSVYLAAFWPQRGQSVMDLLGDGPPPDFLVPRPDDGTMEMTDDVEVTWQVECVDVDFERAGRESPSVRTAVVVELRGPVQCTRSPSPNHLHHLRTGPSSTTRGAGAVVRSR